MLGRRVAHRPLLTAAAVCVVAGLALLGYAGWQLEGTNVVAHHRQHRVVDAVTRVWADPGGRAVTDEDRRLARGVVALVRIPALGAHYVVPAYDGVGSDELDRGFGVEDSSPDPGGRGNLVLVGHRVTHGEPLRGMPALGAGDVVVVETRDRTYTYRLDTAGDALSVDEHAAWVLDAHPVDPDPEGAAPAASPRLLTLVTCAELFHTENRLVAFAHLATATPR